MYLNEMEVAKKLAIDAGNEILKIYAGEIDIKKKNDDSPVTEADKKGNAIIVAGLKKAFPKYSILSEEEKDNKSRLCNDMCFIVDPLDGTKEFIQKNGQFTVNIALSYKHKVVMGVIYVPVTKELYYAAQGNGAYLENIDTGKITEIQVTHKLKDLLIVGSKSHSSEQEKKLIDDHKDVIKETISAGSSLKGCMVAQGSADVYYRFGYTCEWDTGAMQCIVEEAGGIFKQMDGSPMLYNRENVLNEKGFYVVNRKENIWV